MSDGYSDVGFTFALFVLVGLGLGTIVGIKVGFLVGTGVETSILGVLVGNGVIVGTNVLVGVWVGWI